MGLLDSLFQPSTYGGQGGLLDRLLPSLGNYQSAGFQQQPDQQQAAPMSIGGYQMPRMGNPDQFQPQQAMTPPNAQPTQGQGMPQGAPQQPQQAQEPQLPPSFGGGGYLDRLNNGGGLISSLFGDSGQQKNLAAQFQAIRQTLISNGESPQAASSKAMLAVQNPEASKTILTEALTNKTDIKMVKDGFGQEHPYSWNPVTQEFKPLGGGSSSGGDAQGLTDKVASMAQSGATRQQMLQQVPSDYRGHVEAVLDGRALPSNIGRGPARAAIMATAHAIDPTFDESNIPLRFKTASDYAPNGQSGRSIVALNTVQHHIGKLSDDLENMGDTGWTVLNSIRNGVAVNTPLDPKQGTAVQAVQDDIKAVTDEMSAAYKAGKVSDHEIEAWNKLANSNLPARQLKQGIYDFVGLLNGKRDQLNETHQAILGRDAPGVNKDLNESITKKVGERNSGTSSAASAGGVQEGATATNPQTGQKITFRNGKWQ
jgi:hypothetical protein